MSIAEQLNITEFPFEIWNKVGSPLYYEYSNGYWVKRRYDSDGKRICYESTDGYWIKRKYDSQGNELYREYSSGEIVDYR